MYVPPSTNLVIIRVGIFGSGQVWFDDAQLAVRPPASRRALPLGKNLLANPGFERPLDEWEFSMPPTPQAAIIARLDGGAHGPLLGALRRRRSRPRSRPT